MKNVLILLSTYNGEKYIKEQLDSLINQKNVKLNILIRDDGSTDNTTNIIREYQKKYNNISYYSGKNIGYAASFWNLVKKSDDNYDYYAFCDQDDIWDENKVYNAVKMLKKYEEIPALYTSRVVSVDNDMNVLNENTFESRVLTKYEALQKSIIPGCVFVLNKNAKNMISKFDGYMESHDWATYAIISSFGKVIYDNNSYIKYRIHGNNTIGKKSKFNSLKIKFLRFFKKSKCTRSRFATDFYETYKNELNDKIYKDSLFQLAYYKKNIRLKLKLLNNKNYKGVVFKIYVLLNKV